MDTQALLQMMMSAKRDGIGPRQILQQVASESDDPAVASLLATMMTDSEPAVVDAVPVDDANDDRPATSEARLLLREAQAQMRRLSAENEEMRSIIDALTDGLGACPLCLGDRHDCVVCSGRGAPGSGLPDPAAFRKYVAPAVRRVQRELGPVRPSRRDPS